MLAFEDHVALSGQGDDRDRAGMPDVVAHRLRAVGQAHHVAVNFKETAGVHRLAGNTLFREFAAFQFVTGS